MNPLDFPTPPSICKKKTSAFRDVSNTCNSDRNNNVNSIGEFRQENSDKDVRILGKKASRRTSSRFLPGLMKGAEEENMTKSIDNENVSENLDDCLLLDNDVAIQSSKRRRSSIYVSSASDSWNEKICADASPGGQSKEDSSSDVIASKVSRSKRRQSIILPSQNSSLMEIMDKPEAERENKQKSRRQSIQLPSENSTLSEMIDNTKTDDEERIAIDSKTNTINVSNDDFARIRESIRQFCKLSVKDRADSSALKTIQSLSDYPISSWAGCQGKVTQNTENFDLNWSSSPNVTNYTMSSKAQKRALLEKFIPDFERLEMRKLDETATLEAFTRCKAKKKNGRFRYTEIETGEGVSAEEYEKRYYQYLAAEREQRMVGSRSDSPSLSMESNKNCLTPSISPILVRSRRSKETIEIRTCESNKEREDTAMDISVIENENVNLSTEMSENISNDSCNIWDQNDKLFSSEAHDCVW